MQGNAISCIERAHAPQAHPISGELATTRLTVSSPGYRKNNCVLGRRPGMGVLPTSCGRPEAGQSRCDGGSCRQPASRDLQKRFVDFSGSFEHECSRPVRWTCWHTAEGPRRALRLEIAGAEVVGSLLSVVHSRGGGVGAGASGSAPRGRTGARACGRGVPGQHLHDELPDQPSVAAAADGDFVVVWQSYRLVRDGHEQLTASRASATPRTDPRWVRSSRSTPTRRATSCVPPWRRLPTGISSWCGRASARLGRTRAAQHPGPALRLGRIGPGRGVPGQHLHDGQPVSPSVAAAADGDFVVVWDSVGSSGTDTSRPASRASATPRTDPPRVRSSRSTPTRRATRPTPPWRRLPTGTSSWCGSAGARLGRTRATASIQGQRYASDGSPQGAEFQVNTYTTGSQTAPSVAADADGDFVVVWDSDGSSGTDTSSIQHPGPALRLERIAQGAEFQVNTYTTSSQLRPSVAAAANGDFVVVWDSVGLVRGWTRATPASRASATPRTDRRRVRSSRSTPTRRAASCVPPLRRLPSGDFVVAWESYGSSGTDTTTWSIQGQRYSVPAAVIPVPSMSLAPRFVLATALALLGATWALRRRA